MFGHSFRNFFFFFFIKSCSAFLKRIFFSRSLLLCSSRFSRLSRCIHGRVRTSGTMLRSILRRSLFALSLSGKSSTRDPVVRAYDRLDRSRCLLWSSERHYARYGGSHILKMASFTATSCPPSSNGGLVRERASDATGRVRRSVDVVPRVSYQFLVFERKRERELRFIGKKICRKFRQFEAHGYETSPGEVREQRFDFWRHEGSMLHRGVYTGCAKAWGALMTLVQFEQLKWLILC